MRHQESEHRALCGDVCVLRSLGCGKVFVEVTLQLGTEGRKGSQSGELGKGKVLRQS